MNRAQQVPLFADAAIPRSGAVAEAVRVLASEGGVEERGAVFTSPEVVAAILDLCEYTEDRDLLDLRILEPAFGGGDFLVPVVERLLGSLGRSGCPPRDVLPELRDAIRAVELHEETFEETHRRVGAQLLQAGLTLSQAEEVLQHWLVRDDFLLADLDGSFDVVVGNPPYVRQERVPTVLLRTYRERFETLVHRADLYVPFYEKGLELLRDGGVLGYICSNRWVRNRYGSALRALVGGGYHLQYFVDLERASAFQSDVIAYPAITVLRRAPGSATLIAAGVDSKDDLIRTTQDLRTSRQTGKGAGRVSSAPVVTPSPDPWLLDCPDLVGHLRALEQRFPSLEEAGARVTIGVATGADRVFIGSFDDLPVEESRKLPLAMAADCRDGRICWGGKGVVNPFFEDGRLAPLEAYPRFASYLREHQALLAARHTAQRQPDRWYRTIDRIYPSLTHEPKLLIPDIKGDAAITYDEGRYYPHHNLYVVTSREWDLRGLMALLRSSLALAFVAAYSPRMSGGFLRFQAQYLRRIRSPRWSDLSREERSKLVAAADNPLDACDEAVFSVLGVSDTAAEAIRHYASSARVLGRSR